MATLPTFERLLLEIASALEIDFSDSTEDGVIGLNHPDTWRKFERCEDVYDLHKRREKGIVEEICRVIAREEDRIWIRKEIYEFREFYRGIELSTYTFNANSRHITWHLFGLILMPYLGRRVALLQLNSPIDSGMPGGEFWYLPRPVKKSGKISQRMPVAHVIEWLFDLIGRPIADFTEELGWKDTDPENIKKTLHDWRKNGDLPKLKTIERIFSEQCQLGFKGCFSFEKSREISDSFKDALNFVKAKKITVNQLSDQIPMRPKRIALVLKNDSSSDDKKKFIEQLARRYFKPSMQIVRQKLIVAKAIQSGYVQLVKLLCPGIDKGCIDACRNKVVQLIGIYEHVYNLTIEAHAHGGDSFDRKAWREEQDKWFEEQLIQRYPVECAAGIFDAILSSHSNGDLPNCLGRRASSHFVNLQGNEPLEDLWRYDKKSYKRILERTSLRYEKKILRFQLTNQLRDKVLTSATNNALQSVTDFELVNAIGFADDNVGENVRANICLRMRELAQTDSEKIIAIMAQLHLYLDGERKDLAEGHKSHVAQLLDEAEVNPAYDLFKAQLLQYKAKHYLAQNQFAKAKDLFGVALDSCLERSFGPFRGQIGRDLFSLCVAEFRLTPAHHEKYFRSALFGKMFEVDNPDDATMQAAALSAAEYFWCDLYKPYPDEEQKERPIINLMEEFNKCLTAIFHKDDWQPLDVWLAKHPQFKSKQLPDVRGGTIIREWLRLYEGHMELLSIFTAETPLLEFSEHERYKYVATNSQRATITSANKFPKLINVPDFLSQTPLMLAAEFGDYIMLEAFLDAGADLNKRDFEGASALHFACRGRTDEVRRKLITEGITKAFLNPDVSRLHGQPWHDMTIRKNAFECAMLLLSRRIDPEIATVHGDTALHFAVKFGHPDIVKLLKKNPILIEKKNENGQTPVELVSWILTDWSRFTQAMMDEQGRKYGTPDIYKEIAKLLEASPGL